jgi:hypothetical protein
MQSLGISAFTPACVRERELRLQIVTAVLQLQRATPCVPVGSGPVAFRTRD